jgi:tetratricopeptide (TPR) repeat protein
MSLTLGFASARVLLGLAGFGYSLYNADFGAGATVSNEILKSVFGGAVGNAAYDLLKGSSVSALEKIASSLQQGDSENRNHDLQRAARKAQLTATLVAVRACLKETQRLNAREKSFWSKARGWIIQDADVTWLNEVARKWQEKIAEVPTEVLPQNIEPDQIIGLFDPQLNFAPAEIQKQITEKLQEDALTEIRSEYYPTTFSQNASSLLEEAIRTGWNETERDKKSSSGVPSLYPLELKQALINADRQYDWFSLVCGFFNEEYKENARVQAAMQKYLLLDIRDRQGQAIMDANGQPVGAEIFFGHLAQFGDSFARLEALLKTIDAKQDEILVFVNRFIEENRRLHKETQQVVRDTAAETQRTVTDESGKIQQRMNEGFSYLADLIEQDKALSPEKREAIEEANRQEYQREIALEYTPSEVVGSLIERDRFFVDRDTERESLKMRLLAGEKMIVVKAFSGYGKTSLITEVLHTIAPHEQLSHEQVRGILLFYCRDKEQASLREVCRKTDARLQKANVNSNFVEAYEAFKRQARDNPNILPTALIDKLIHDLSLLGDIWLVFDNFETALDGATVRDAELREFFVRALLIANRLRFLVTSQKLPQFENLNEVGELPIGDLPEDFAKEFLRKKGVELKADKIDCGLAEAGEAVLDTLLGETSAVPMRLVSFVVYLREAYLTQGKVLTDALTDAGVMAAFREHDTKKGSMQLLEKQYLLLNATEQLILRALSIFPRAVPFTVLKSILPLTLDGDKVLSCLMSSSLVRRTGSSYELLTLPKEVIVKQAEKGGESFSRREMHTRAADFYASIRKPEEQWKTIEDFAPQFEELYHCRQAELYGRAANVLYGKAIDFLRRAGYSRHMIAELKELVGKPMDEWSRAYNSGSLAIACSSLGEKRTAIKYSNEALEAFRLLKDRENEGIVLGNIGRNYSALGEKLKALEYYEDALTIHREVGDRVNEGTGLRSIGTAYLNLGENRKALEYYEDALTIHHEVGDKVNEGIVLGNIGVAYLNLGENRKALEYFEQAVVVHREGDNKVGEGVVLGHIGNAYSALGEKLKALEYYEDALTIHREVGNRVDEGAVLGTKGMTKFELGEKEEGIQLVEQALEIARQLEDKMFEDIWLKKLALMKDDGGDAP